MCESCCCLNFGGNFQDASQISLRCLLSPKKPFICFSSGISVDEKKFLRITTKSRMFELMKLPYADVHSRKMCVDRFSRFSKWSCCCCNVYWLVWIFYIGFSSSTSESKEISISNRIKSSLRFMNKFTPAILLSDETHKQTEQQTAIPKSLGHMLQCIEKLSRFLLVLLPLHPF